MRSPQGVALLVLAAVVAGCGQETAPSRPARPWEEARIEGLESASGVAAWKDLLLFTSSVQKGTSKSLFAVRRDDVKDGATIRCRKIPLEVDGQREMSFSTPQGLRSFRLKDVWEGDPKFSGLCVGSPDLLYVASESYRIVWFGPLDVAADGTLEGCRFERAFEVPAARRTKANASDWHDYGDDAAEDGVAGITIAGDDVVAIERSRGGPKGLVFRLDRVAGTAGDATMLPLPEADAPGTRWWSDVARAGSGFLAAQVRRPAGSEAETRIVKFARVNTSDLSEGGPRTETLFTVPGSPDGGGWVEGMTVADGRLWLVTGGGTRERPTRLAWRSFP